MNIVVEQLTMLAGAMAPVVENALSPAVPTLTPDERQAARDLLIGLWHDLERIDSAVCGVCTHPLPQRPFWALAVERSEVAILPWERGVA